MSPEAFLKTIYLGDCACRSVHIDGVNERIELEVDVVSRIRSATGRWEFYADEDIENGRLVFTGVRAFEMAPAGLIPNDLINDISVAQGAAGEWDFVLSISSVADDGRSTEVLLRVTATGLHLEDPSCPGVELRE